MEENRPALQDSLPIAVDVMGGDRGTGVAVEGAVAAYRELGISSILVGRQDEISSALERLGATSEAGISVQHASQIITMDDTPSSAIRSKPDASIRLAFELVKSGKASSVVSPGNTGAVMVAGVFVSGVMPAITRPAIATLIPKAGDRTPTVLLDCGANLDCDAHQLVQFALMGKCYAQIALSIASPRIAILSNGTEASKGTDITRAAASILASIPTVSFAGYVEGRDIGRDGIDVVVCDGFVGNIVLKAMEGTAALVLDSIKHSVEGSLRGKIGLWLARPLIKALFHEKLDPSSPGGAPLLGLNDVAIICHGSSNARAIRNAVKVAHTFVKKDLIGALDSSLGLLEDVQPGSLEGSLWEKISRRLEKRRSKNHGQNGNA